MRDLIDECSEDLADFGYETVDLKGFGATISKLFVDSKEKSERLGFDCGHYFILNFPKIVDFSQPQRDFLVAEMTYRLKFLLKENKIRRKDKILCVGIGNPAVIADSFGVKVIDKIEIFPFRKNNRVLKICPNTFSNTGINAYDMIRLIVEAFDVKAVLLFDSLATENLARLGASIQFNDAGLTPGSALNNFGKPINRSSLNVPCLAVGVPMMISSKVFSSSKEIILTEKDAREKINFLSDVVSSCVQNVLFSENGK